MGSIPAGIRCVPGGRFVLVTALGTAIRTGALVFAGQQPGEKFGQIGRWLDPVTNVVLGGLIAWCLWRVLRYRHDHECTGQLT